MAFKKLALLASFFFSCANIFAQSFGTIVTGIVTDKSLKQQDLFTTISFHGIIVVSLSLKFVFN